MITVWLVVVTVTSTLVWAVISRAGDNLVSSAQPPVARTDAAEPPPSASGARRTWQGSAGLIVASCDRGAIRLVSAQPISGFHAEIKADGPDKLEVEFEARDDRGGGDVTVVARCAAGVPDFASAGEDD
jgi:hypothetical protein